MTVYALDPQKLSDEVNAFMSANKIVKKEPQQLSGLVGDPVDTLAVEEYVRQCQSLMVDDTMANAAGTIDAIGYVDMHSNVNESNDGYIQDNGSSNRIAWSSVNGVTTPATLRELNIKNSGP